ncbi:hypothetical protein VPNG_02110 [Cytospora leucostoma]|uniref:ABC transporter domain-containing protein n=1 Tax=Cytospora leucostoma TaxID=1230097 RepID=A0A423XHT7_9PEZI|nr:hypothetical protein VPNG_02110 [Cytospora leucostoma]
MDLRTVCGDSSFGPGVKSADCRGGFDFTVLFEETILTILPAVCFILLTPFRALRLFRRRLRIRRNALYFGKLGSIAVYTGLQVAILVLITRNPVIRTDVSIASTTLSLVSALTLAVLSHFEHVRSVRPSFLINLYLIATVLFDVARVRTRWQIGSEDAIASALTAALAVKCAVLLLEAVEKRSLLLGLDRRFSYESTSGLFSRSSFWWLNSLLLSGFKNVLTLDTLPAIYEKLDSESLTIRLQCTWDKFYLIQEAVTYVQGTQSITTGYGLVGAFGLVYIGLAIMMGWSSHLSYRLMTMMRGQLISLIYTKMLALPIADVNDSAAMSLMGTDVQRIAETFWYLLIEVVPSLVQVGVAVYLLYVQLGAVCVAPIIVTIISTGLSVQIAGLITSRQKAWLGAVQRRINYTSGILGSMRNVKMLGLTSQMSANISQLRRTEIATSKRYRKVQSLNTSLVNLPETFNGFLIFAAYAIVAHLQGGSGMSVSQAMTSLAALNLLSAPLGTLLSAIPQGWAALGCFDRIQVFLLELPRSERRMLPSTRTSTESASDQEGIRLEAIRVPLQNKITVNQGSFGWSDSNPHVVEEVDTTIQVGSELAILVGPVGCGKSTLLKGLLGETTKIGGQIRISSSEIAYCDQTPWVFNGSIRDNVLAMSEYDDAWYATVLQACSLDVDLRQMPDGDSTVVGSQGVKLSGGQKQRISVARAVYSRKKVAILDDVLSGLDSVTEEIVFRRVFGPNGLFRKIGTTVILATHSVKRLPQADLILVLNEHGKVVEQGSFAELNVVGNYIHNLQVKLEEAEASNDDDNIEDAKNSTNSPKAIIPPTEAVADKSRRTGDWAIYRYYARALGPWGLLMFAALVAGNQTFIGMSNVWLNWWAESNDKGGKPDLGYWLGMFGFLSFMQGTLMVAACAFLWIVMIPRSGKNLHKSILTAAMRAPLSFFSQTETGVLVNRFSQDLRHADMTLPASIVNCAFQLGTCLVSVSLSITAVGYFAAVLPVVLVALYLIQNFYLRTSRQLRLLELEANAPLYTHFIESLAGLITIRAFGWAEAYAAKNRRLVDDSQKPYYLLLCIQRWLVLVLDLVVAGLALVLVGMAVALRSHMNPGFLGLALVNMMNLSHSLTNLVQYWTNLETSLGAIARIKDFAENTPVEGAPGEDALLDVSWPSQGALRFESVSASYSEAASPVLKEISFSVEGGQKIGIVGRTGSGKSSSTLAILGLINIVSGRIVLDGIDLATVPGSVVRERLTCLTQDPFIFPASVRSNLDPLDRSPDDAIVAALQRVGLWDVLREKATDKTSGSSGVLATTVDTDLLSHGQRQLFCLARAMLKPGKVLILDEPTSRQVESPSQRYSLKHTDGVMFQYSVDTKTDAQMQELIRSEFQGRTIIMIAHRLSSLVDFDRVAVLDGGRLVEFGQPSELLEDGSSRFARLYSSSVSK